MRRFSIFQFVILLVAAAFMFSASHLQAKEGKIKAGITITPNNYKEYLAELKEITDPNTYLNIVQALEKGLVTLPIKENVTYPPDPYFQKASLENAGKSRIGSDSQLVGWVAGLPFPKPKSGAELAWNLDRRNMTDNYSNDGIFSLVNKNGKLEREMRWSYRAVHYNGRVKMSPMPELTGNNGVVRKKQAFVMLKPFDLKGFSFIRTRFEDRKKNDDVYIYVPAIRRIRRMTGKDTADPMVGSDAIYDDFEYFSQKITPQMTYSMEERVMLVPITPLPPSDVKLSKSNSKKARSRLHEFYFYPEQRAARPAFNGNIFFQLDWQIRPVYVLTINTNDNEYPYNRRVFYMEKKERLTGIGSSVNTYDQKGRLFRGEFYIEEIQPGPEFAPSCWYCKYSNFLNGHSSTLRLDVHLYDKKVEPKQLSFKWLLKQTR